MKTHTPKMKALLLHIARITSLALAAIALTSCAIQTSPGGQFQVGLDDAELLGQTLASFKLADGSEGRLRVLNGQFSLKLQKYFKVLNIPNATLVKVVSADPIGGRTLVVLEKAERNCNYKTEVLSIQGSEVLIWEFGDCDSKPAAQIQTDHATFDFVRSQRTTRFTYRDARLSRAEYPTATAGPPGSAPIPATPINTSAPRYVPGPPVVSTPLGSQARQAVRPPPMAPQTPAPARVTSSNQTAPPPARTLDFPAQEQKPVRIVLDK